MSVDNAFQITAFQRSAFQIDTTAAIPPSGPMVNEHTVLTKGVPGKHFTKRHKNEFLNQVYQEGIAAKEALRRLEGLSELEKAELELFEAEEAYQAVGETLKTRHSRKLYEEADDASSRLRIAQERVDLLRIAEAKELALREAKARIQQQVRDAIDALRKRR